MSHRRIATPLGLVTALASALATLPAAAAPAVPSDGEAAPSFHDVIQRVTLMPNDADLQRRAWYKHRLNVLNLTWEDTGRFSGSSVGPNISDLTLQVHEKTARGRRTYLLPVLRAPNFTDKTADIPADKIKVRVGNQGAEDGRTTVVPLTSVLENIQEYLSDPDSVKGSGNLLAKRDTHFLVSAQHVFVPLPTEGTVEFNPVLFNYQSSPGAPAVATLLVTRQGTSFTIIENRGDDMPQQAWGQQLYFNHAGQETLFTAERRSAVKARIDSGNAGAQDKGALDEGADMMMIVQVPLKVAAPRRTFGIGGFGGGGYAPSAAAGDSDVMLDAAETKSSARGSGRARGDSNVERAVIGHGDALGKFEEGRGRRLVRDARFPVRVTIQFYKATSNGVVSDTDLASAAADIARVYKDADYVGSLVVPESDVQRPTDWDHAGDTGPIGFSMFGWQVPLAP